MIDFLTCEMLYHNLDKKPRGSVRGRPSEHSVIILLGVRQTTVTPLPLSHKYSHSLAHTYPISSSKSSRCCFPIKIRPNYALWALCTPNQNFSRMQWAFKKSPGFGIRPVLKVVLLWSREALFSVNIKFISLQGQTQLMKSSRFNSGTKSVFYIDGNSGLKYLFKILAKLWKNIGFLYVLLKTEWGSAKRQHESVVHFQECIS